MHYNGKSWVLNRYPKTSNNSLQAWSAIDELLLETGSLSLSDTGKTLLINDAFGALTCSLFHLNPDVVIDRYSQVKAIRENLNNNKLKAKNLNWHKPLKVNIKSASVALIRIPKSLNLFELYLSIVQNKLDVNGTAYCGFMTRNFTPALIELAGNLFNVVEQTKAYKKARVLVLKDPKSSVTHKTTFGDVINELGLQLKQYPGVFSADKVDIATQLLLSKLPEFEATDKILDLACGNGVVASFIRKRNPNCELTLLDDSSLAISSAKLNVSKEGANFIWSDSLKSLKEEKYNYILCNPPFHFEYENTLEIALSLFKESVNHIEVGGKLIIVANTHLNYKTHLQHLFKETKQILKSDKYEIIECS